MKLWLFIFLLIPSVAFAQTTAEEGDELEDVEVVDEETDEDDDEDTSVTTTRRLGGELEGRPARVERIRSEDLERRGATNMAEALDWLSSGSQISPTGTATGIIVDGLPASQVTVLRDGLPITRPTGSPQGPIVDLASIAIVPESIRRIDIYRGVGPVGSGTAGGVVIDIITKNEPPKTNAFLQAQFGGVNNQVAFQDGPRLLSSNLSIGGTIGVSDTVGVDILASKSRLEPVDVDRDLSPDGQLRDGLSGETSLTWRPDDNAFLRLNVLGNSERAENVGRPRAIFDDIVNRRLLRARAAGRWWSGENWRFDHGVDLGTNEQIFEKRVKNSGFIRPKSETVFQDATLTSAARFFVGNHDLAGEVGANGYRVERDGETGVLPTEQEFSGGLGFGHTWYATESIETYERVYGEYSSAYGPAVNAQVAGTLRIADPVTARLSLSTTRRAPTPEELYLFFDHSEVGYQVTGNPELEPERLYSVQLGTVLTSNDKKSGLEVMGFYHRLTNAITIVNEQSGAIGLFSYENRSGAHTGGAQLSGQTELPGKVELKANYTFMPLAADTEDDSRLPLRAEHSARLEIRRGFFSRRWQIWTDGNVRSAVEVPEGSPESPEYFLWGIGTSYQVSKNIRVLLDFNNLLNQTNSTWGPLPGTTALLTLVGRFSAE